MALFSRVVTWSMLFYRCRASIKCIFHFQCIACIWFRRQFWFTSYFILWLENIAMERRERKNRTGNGNACHGEFRNLQRDFNAWMMLKTNVWSVQRSKVIQFHLEPFIAVVLWLILICRVWNEALTKTRLFVCVQIVETRTMHPLVLSECITFSAVHENVRIGTPYSSICWAFFLSLLAGVLKNRRIANFSVEFAICSASGFCSIQRTIGKWANENKKWNHFLWKIILLRTINGMGGMCGCGSDWIKFT